MAIGRKTHWDTYRYENIIYKNKLIIIHHIITLWTTVITQRSMTHLVVAILYIGDTHCTTENFGPLSNLEKCYVQIATYHTENHKGQRSMTHLVVEILYPGASTYTGLGCVAAGWFSGLAYAGVICV
jgi:hypothetical protein